jgi:hypothetical protein
MQDLATFLTSGILTPEEGRQVIQFSRECCSTLAPNVVDLVSSGFGIPVHAIGAPIAADWSKYNQFDNRGEVTADMGLW